MSTLKTILKRIVGGRAHTYWNSQTIVHPIHTHEIECLEELLSTIADTTGYSYRNRRTRGKPWSAEDLVGNKKLLAKIDMWIDQRDRPDYGEYRNRHSDGQETIMKKFYKECEQEIKDLINLYTRLLEMILLKSTPYNRNNVIKVKGSKVQYEFISPHILNNSGLTWFFLSSMRDAQLLAYFGGHAKIFNDKNITVKNLNRIIKNGSWKSALKLWLKAVDKILNNTKFSSGHCSHAILNRRSIIAIKYLVLNGGYKFLQQHNNFGKSSWRNVCPNCDGQCCDEDDGENLGFYTRFLPWIRSRKTTEYSTFNKLTTLGQTNRLKRNLAL